VKTYGRQIIVTSLVAIAHQFVGIVPIIYFSNSIFAETSLTSYWSSVWTLILACTAVAGSLFMAILEKITSLSVKKVLVAGLFILPVILFTMAILFIVGGDVAIRILMLCYIFTFFCTLGQTFFPLIGEILPWKARSLVVSLNGLSMCIVALTFLWIHYSSIGTAGAFFIYGGVTLVVGIYTIIALPEYKAMTFEQITELFERGRIRGRPAANATTPPMIELDALESVPSEENLARALKKDAINSHALENYRLDPIFNRL